MVWDNEKVVEMQGLRKKQPEEVRPMSKHDRDILGGAAVRLEIPIADAQFHELEEIADILIGAGNALKVQAQRRREKNGPTEREIKYSMRSFLLGARESIRRVTPGSWNRNGTVRT